MIVETEGGIVRIEQDVSTVMNGWSKRIQPKLPFGNEQTLWLNTYVDFWKREDQ